MKEQIIARIATKFSELDAIPFFPDKEDGRTAIMRAMARFIINPDHVDWLIETAVATMSKWPGVPELRALYCTRYRPGDGLPEPDCTISGYTPADSEGQYHQVQAAQTDRLLDEYKQKLIAGPPSSEPAIDPEIAARLIKRIPPPPLRSRTEDAARDRESREKLANLVGASSKPISISATPTRTPEQRAQLEAELRAQLQQLKGNDPQ